MDLEKEIRKLETSFFDDNVYSFSPKLSYKVLVKKGINDIISRYDGLIYDLSHEYHLGLTIYFLLTDENRKKMYHHDHVRKTRWNNNYFFHLAKQIFPMRAHPKFMLVSINKEYIRIKSWVQHTHPDVRIIHLFRKVFKFLHKCQEINLPEEFYITTGFRLNEGWHKNLCITYEDIHESEQMVFKCNGPELVSHLKRLFGEYFSMHDYYNAERILNKLICHLDESEKELYRRYWTEFEEIIRKAKDNISGKEHIVLNWVDGLRYDELNNMPLLSKKAEHSIFFEKMYTSTPYTHIVARNIFTGKYLIEDKLHSMSLKDFNNGILMQELKRHGYTVVASNRYVTDTWIKDNTLSCIEMSYEGTNKVPCSVYQFHALCNMLKHNKIFSIVHNFSEIHPPRISPDYVRPGNGDIGDWEREHIDDFYAQVKTGELHVDHKMDYYGKIYEGAKYKIYMSDHGQMRFEDHFTIEGMHHVIFFIDSDEIKEDRIGKIYDLADFTEMFKCILDGDLNFLESIGKGYAIIELDDTYNKERCTSLIAKSKSGECRDILQWLQYRGIVNQAGGM